MRFIVLDTNVLVSAGIRPASPPATIIMDWVLEGHAQTVTCPGIIREYRDVARRPTFDRYGFPPLWLEFMIEESLCLPDPPPWPLPGPDPSDLPFLALAHQAGAWLVTGNLRHSPQDCRSGVPVLGPAEYLAHLTA
jgi:predicted nucleic acid-binding protein